MFRTNIRHGRATSTGVRRGGAALGSCEGAAAGPRVGAANGSYERAASTFRGVPPENLTFKIKFLWSYVVVKI